MQDQPVKPLHELIDWQGVFTHPWQENRGDGPDKANPAFWHQRAADFAAKAHAPETRQANEELLGRFRWRADETVLDVGAGPGAFAVPLSRRVGKVTALDASGAMLAELRRQCEREPVGRIETVEGRWLSIAPPGVHDTVLCLNAIGVIALADTGGCRLDLAIDRLRDATGRRLIILVPHADSPADEAMRQALGLDEAGVERQRVGLLYLALVQRGILADLHIVRRPFTWTFCDDAEAVETLGRRLGLLDQPARRAALAAHLTARLVTEGGRRWLRQNIAQALYVWHRRASDAGETGGAGGVAVD